MLVLSVFASIFVLSLSGCVSSIDWRKMDMDANIGSRSQLYNLRNTTLNHELYDQAEKMTSNGYFDVTSPEYGYYTIGIQDSQDLSGSGVAYVLINSFTLFVLSIVGFQGERIISPSQSGIIGARPIF
ncbi:hypothetical protein ACYULU_03565 [Breznakiellaceae bacterium SP9]